MKIKKYIAVLLIMSFCLTPRASFAASYEVESKPGALIWTNISASNAYDVCIGMTSGTSSIGSGALNPHMATPKDYDAVAVLAISNYGDCTGDTGYAPVNGYNSTTANSTGVMNFGKYPSQNGSGIAYTFTSGILDQATSNSYTKSTTYSKSLYDNRNSGFVNLIYSGGASYTTSGPYWPTTSDSDKTTVRSWRNNAQNKGMGIGNTDNETGALSTWYSEKSGSQLWGYEYNDGRYYFENAERIVLVKRNLFGFNVGHWYGTTAVTGLAGSDRTFRPVLWNSSL